MKRIFLSTCILFACCFTASSQSIKMKIASVTPTAGETILAFENSNGSPVTSTSTGFSVGQNTFTEVKIKKAAGGSSNELFRRSLVGSITSEIAFEWYDASNTLFYKIVILDCLPTNFANLSPECNNCTTLGNEISFIFKKIEVTDIVTGVTVRYNLTTRTTY